jgi:hypothetical protein
MVTTQSYLDVHGLMADGLHGWNVKKFNDWMFDWLNGWMVVTCNLVRLIGWTVRWWNAWMCGNNNGEYFNEWMAGGMSEC